jgi:hypothetical protein
VKKGGKKSINLSENGADFAFVRRGRKYSI